MHDFGSAASGPGVSPLQLKVAARRLTRTLGVHSSQSLLEKFRSPPVEVVHHPHQSGDVEHTYGQIDVPGQQIDNGKGNGDAH